MKCFTARKRHTFLPFIMENLPIHPSYTKKEWCTMEWNIFLKCVFQRTIHHTIAQSICTHYSSLSGWPDIFLWSGTWKKSGPKNGPDLLTHIFKTRIVDADWLGEWNLKPRLFKVLPAFLCTIMRWCNEEL